jgi:glyoxylase-like metal-dependent hydrolase (beta-lactamase superfamily II)
VPTADELQNVVPGCYLWQAYSPEAKVELTSHALVSGKDIFLVDPIGLTKKAFAELEAIPGNIAAVLLTNGNHERDAVALRDRYHVPIYAHPAAGSEFEFETVDISALSSELEIIPLRGAGPGEVGIYDRQKRLLILGDIVINLSSYDFAPLPAKYATDVKEMQRSLAALKTLDVSTICFAHGLPVTTRAAERLASLSA